MRNTAPPKNKTTNKACWAEQDRLITDALMKFARRAMETPGTIPYDQTIQGMGREILHLFYRYDPTPQDVAALEKIKKMKKETATLRATLTRCWLDLEGGMQAENLHIGAKFGLAGFIEAHKLLDALVSFENRCNQAIAATRLPAAKRGRPKRGETVVEIVRFLAIQYERLTGKRATRNNRGDRVSEFVDLVQSVFHALGIGDSADDATRDALG